MALPALSSFFFFNDTATTEIYTLSLHDALPIWATFRNGSRGETRIPRWHTVRVPNRRDFWIAFPDVRSIREGGERSEEHTSELQSQSNLVCRLLLEKKKQARTEPFTR